MSERARGHPDEDTLHRVAERGPGEAEPPVRDHLRACRACRDEVEGLRRVLRAAEELPTGIAPGRDLWDGVEERIRAGGRHGGDGRGRSPGTGAPPAAGRPPGEGADGTGPGGRRLREAAPWLAAAAAVLIAVTSGATLWLASGGGPAADDADPAAGGRAARAPAGPVARTAAGPGAAAGIPSGYRPVVDRLEGLFERREERLPAPTRRVLERNLAIIDAAIAETEAALAEHPSSPGLLRTLDRTYDRKVELLRRSARLAARL